MKRHIEDPQEGGSRKLASTAPGDNFGDEYVEESKPFVEQKVVNEQQAGDPQEGGSRREII